MSDPNDIVQKGRLPSRLEKVAEAGGFEERATERELELQNQVIINMAKIKPKGWIAIGKTVEILSDFVEGGVIGGFKDIGQDLKESLSLTIQEAMSPLKNEIEQSLAEALEPIMPEIQAFTTEIAGWFRIAIGSWEALIKGDWDAVLADISKKMPDWLKQFKNDFNRYLFEASQERISDFEQWRQDMDTLFGNIAAGWSGFWSDLGWK